MSQDVRDRPAEKLISVGNIIQALVLMVMSWVGYNIDSINKSIGALNTGVTVNASNIQHNADSINTHILRHHK